MAVQVKAEELFWVQTIDRNASGTGNGYCPIVIDSNNLPHIAYTGVAADSTGDMTFCVRYASWNGTCWNTQTIDQGMAYSLVLKNGNPYILYGSSKGLICASWNGYQWVTNIVDKDGAVFGVITSDSSGNLYVAYNDGTNIKYASGSGSNWNIQTIPTHEQGIIAYLSCQLDKNNTPHIMYYSESTYFDKSTGVNYRSLDVKIATNHNSVWKIENVSLPPPVTYFGNMVLDSNDNPELIYTQSRWTSATDTTSINSLIYAHWNGNAWETQTVVPNTDITNNYVMDTAGFLALDSNDQPHISYISSSSGLTYASLTNDNIWKTQTIDNYVNTSARWPCYMAIDANHNPHISYIATSADIGLPNYTVHMMYTTANTTAETNASPQTSSPIENTSITPELTILFLSIFTLGIVVILGLYRWKKKKQ
jgi:hypothetical protein